MCVCVCVCVCIHDYVYVWLCIPECVCVCVCVCECEGWGVCVCVCVCGCVCVCVCPAWLRSPAAVLECCAAKESKRALPAACPLTSDPCRELSAGHAVSRRRLLECVCVRERQREPFAPFVDTCFSFFTSFQCLTQQLSCSFCFNLHFSLCVVLCVCVCVCVCWLVCVVVCVCVLAIDMTFSPDVGGN